MGQTRPVQIINLVAKGTIEEGMLSTLAFKRSLSEGILDGGVGEISLGGSRLNRFMKDVEKATAPLDTGEAVTPDEEVAGAATPEVPEVISTAPVDTLETPEGEDSGETESVAASYAPHAAQTDPQAQTDLASGQSANSPPVAPMADPWQALAQLGTQLLGAFATAQSPAAAAHPWVERDSHTGKQHLKIPMPSPEISHQIANALAAMAESLRGSVK